MSERKKVSVSTPNIVFRLNLNPNTLRDTTNKIALMAKYGILYRKTGSKIDNGGDTGYSSGSDVIGK